MKKYLLPISLGLGLWLVSNFAMAQAAPAAAAAAPVAATVAVGTTKPADAAKPADATAAAATPVAAAAAPAAPAAAPAPVPNKGDTAWMTISTVLVLLMTIPGLALFYGGLVRSKNMLSVLMQVFVVTALIFVLWVIYGYTLAFTAGNPFFGSFDKLFLKGITPDSVAATFSKGVVIPELIFVAFQATFAAITCGLIVGSFAERAKFSAVLLFCVLWFTFSYLPMAHMVWYFDGPDAITDAASLEKVTAAAGWLWAKGALDFAGGTVVHSHNMSEEHIARVKAQPIRMGEPVVGECAERRAAVQIEDLAQADRSGTPLLDILMRAGVRSILALPLLHQGEVIGALVVRRSYASAFTPETVRLLEAFAAQSSIAVNNARLFKEVEETGRALAVASQHKSQFVANMSHELRTPLAAMLGYAELMREGLFGALPAEAMSTVDRIQDLNSLGTG